MRCVLDKTSSANSPDSFFTFLLPLICVEKLQISVRKQLLLIVKEPPRYRTVIYESGQEQPWLLLQGGHMTHEIPSGRLGDICGVLMHAVPRAVFRANILTKKENLCFT